VALTTLKQTKEMLGVLDDSLDVPIRMCLEAAEAAFARLTDRVLEETDYVDFYSGRGNPVLLLSEYPVSEVTEVRLDNRGYWGDVADSFGDTTILEQGIDYSVVKDGRNGAISTARLYKINGVWPGKWVQKAGALGSVHRPGAGNIKVTYTAGYARIPMDVQRILCETVAVLFARRQTGRPLLEEDYEEYRYKMGSMAEDYMQLGSPAQVVKGYRRLRPRYEVLG
jgi:hypothetical protein